MDHPGLNIELNYAILTILVRLFRIINNSEMEQNARKQDNYRIFRIITTPWIEPPRKYNPMSEAYIEILQSHPLIQPIPKYSPN